MASASVSVRLSEEVIEKLTERANAESKKVSDLVRELIESGLRSGGNAYNSAVLERIEKLEETIQQANTALIGYTSKSVQAAAEARYFARLAAMYEIDIAHYVAQKVEIGVTPQPPDKDEKNRQMTFHEKKCKEYVIDKWNPKAESEPG